MRRNGHRAMSFLLTCFWVVWVLVWMAGQGFLSVGFLDLQEKMKSDLSSIYFFSMHGLWSAHYYYSHCYVPVHYVQLSIETIKMLICGEFSSQKTSHPCPITSSQKKTVPRVDEYFCRCIQLVHFFQLGWTLW